MFWFPCNWKWLFWKIRLVVLLWRRAKYIHNKDFNVIVVFPCTILTKISVRSRQDLSISVAKNLPRSQRDLKISVAKNSPRFSLRCRSTSRRDVENLAEIQKFTNIMVRSRRDGGYLAAISPRFRISETSWRDLYILGEISAILARWRISRQDLAEI